jgi:hypothetical protein
MTDDVTITLILGIFALILVSWAWYLYGQRQLEILKATFAEDKRKTDFFDLPIEKPAKRPRLYKQATVVTKGELPRKASVKKTRPLPSKATIAKKAVGKKTTTTKGSK